MVTTPSWQADADGTIRSRRFSDADGVTFASGAAFRLPLPAITSDTAVLLVRIAELYARADALIYEAKASERNRLAYERPTVFNAAPKGNRRNKQRDAA